MNLQQLARRPAHEVLDLRPDRAIPAPHAIALVLALWTFGRNYYGIVHDATLYVAQGLNRLHGGSLANDLFFAYGSQDSYTLFSFLYAPLLGAFGPAGASLIVVVAGHVAFLFAAAALARQLHASSRWWSLSLLAAMSGHYGGGGVFRIAEPFATARTLAEPLVVAMLASMLAGRLRSAVLCLAAAAVLHPLVALPGLATLFVYCVVTSRRRAILLGAALGLAAAILLAAGPSIDAAWREVLEHRSRHLFVTKWMFADLSRVGWALGVVLIAALTQAGPRRLLLAAAVVAAGGTLASVVLVDLAGSALAAAAQLWRALWLLQLLAVLSVVPLVMRLWSSGPAARLAAAFIAASCCFSRLEQPIAAGLVLGAALLLWRARTHRPWPDERQLKIGMLAAACLGATGLLLDAQTLLPDAYAPEHPTGWKDYLGMLGSVGLLLPLGVLLWLLTLSAAHRWASAATACALAVALATWDERNAWARYVTEAPIPHPFAVHVEPGAEVFWPTVSSPAWTLLRTRNWVSADQGAGVVFSREAAMLWSARESASRRLRDEYSACQIARRTDCPIYAPAARAVCRLPDGPAYVVLNGQVEGWRAVAEDGYAGQTFRLYRCRDAS